MADVDLDRYAQAPRDADTLAARRVALLDQLGWLESEAAALAPLLAALPEWAVRQAPLPTDLSVAETFAALAMFDRDVVSGWLEQIRMAAGDDAPVLLATPQPLTVPAGAAGAAAGAADAPLADLLADVQAARAALREHLAGLDADVWVRPVALDGHATDLYGVALTLCQRDADALRALAYRLHEADLGRPADHTPHLSGDSAA